LLLSYGGEAALSVWAFYGRVSGLEQATNNSIPTQQEACHVKARELGATEVLDFVDAGVPGDLDWTDRPALNRLLNLVEAGAMAGFIAYDPDRLARDLGVQLAITELLAKHNVRLEFVTQEFNASPEGMLFYQIRGAVSQFERAKIRERTSRGRKKILRDGIPANKPGVYGLTYDRINKAWTIIPEQAETVRQIFRWVASGKRPGWVADHLNDAGVAPPKGQRWWKASIHSMITNMTYAGRMYLNRYNHEGEHKNRFLPPERRNKATERPREQWIEVAVPAIIDEPLWEAVQMAQEESTKRWSGRNSKRYQYLASRLIRCGLCGSAMSGTTSSPSRPTYSYYRCSGRYGEKKVLCTMPHLHVSSLDDALWAEVRSWLVEPERHSQALLKATNTLESAHPALKSHIDQQLKEVQEDTARLQSLVDKGIVKEQEVRPALKGLAEREKALLLRQRRPTSEPTEGFKAVPPEVVDRFSAAQRLEYIRGLVKEITAYPNGDVNLTPRNKPRLPE
jgi:site-specific DNA recombinase